MRYCFTLITLLNDNLLDNNLLVDDLLHEAGHLPAVMRSSSLFEERSQTCMLPTEVPVTMMPPSPAGLAGCQVADRTLPLVLGRVLAYCRPAIPSCASKMRNAPSSQATATRCAGPTDQTKGVTAWDPDEASVAGKVSAYCRSATPS